MLWRDNAERAALTQRHEARYQFRLIIWVGVPVILTTVASAVLSSVHADLQKPYDVMVVVLSIASAALASIQTFLGLDSRRSGAHQAAAAYSSVRRRIEMLIAAGEPSDEEMEVIRLDLDNLGKGSPLASEDSFKRVAEKPGLG